MDEFLNSMMGNGGTVITLIEILSVILLLLFMHFSAKHRNKSLGISWYILGVLFPFITALVFLSKRKRFPGANMKVCPICGDKYPMTYQVCGRCLVELPENSPKEKEKQAKISKACGVGYILTGTVVFVATILTIVAMLSNVFGALGNIFEIRIGVLNEAGETVYYDKEGNSYDNPFDVVIYDREGETYTYYLDESDDFTYFVSSSGEEYDSFNCYVDEDGFFYYDEEYLLTYPEESYEDYEDVEWSDMFDEFENYKYYNNYVVDSDGNLYYSADEASWNADGELITAENDPTITE